MRYEMVGAGRVGYVDVQCRKETVLYVCPSVSMYAHPERETHACTHAHTLPFGQFFVFVWLQVGGCSGCIAALLYCVLVYTKVALAGP